MSREYLKELQERAQKLLDMSSDEEDVNAYTATNKTVKSPTRIDLDDYQIQGRQSDDQDKSDRRSTDIELLKRCIGLTNQNNDLKELVERQSYEIQQLKAKLKKKSENEQNFKINLQRKVQYNRENEVQGLGWVVAELKKEIQKIKDQKHQLKRQYEVLQREKGLLKKQIQIQRQNKQHKLRQRPQQIEIYNDYTIKAVKFQDNEKWQSRYQQSQKMLRRLERIVSEQRARVQKLCYFINAQVPQLKDKIVEMTVRLDTKVSKYLLREFSY